jgi:hypothetical protein
MTGGSALRKAATYTQKKSTQTSMSRVGFEPTIPMSKTGKTVHAFDREVTVIGMMTKLHIENILTKNGRE